MKIDSGILTHVTEEDIDPDGTFHTPDGVTTIDVDAFKDCINLTTLVISNGVITIGEAALAGCTKLTYLTIPETVTTIGVSAFYGCIGLTTLTIPNSVTTIDRFSFYRCSGLTTLTIPDSVTTISRDAFALCSGLNTLTIPDSVTIIHRDAFALCNGLATLTISDSILMIGDNAFSGCAALEHIYVRQTQDGGLERIQDLLPTNLSDKVVPVPPAGRLTKRASASSTTASPDNFKKARLFTASEIALPLTALLLKTEKQILAPEQMQLTFKMIADAQAMQNALEHAGIHTGAPSVAQYAIEEISKIDEDEDEDEETESRASAAATDSPSSYAIMLTKAEYNQILEDESAYDQLSQRTNDFQPYRP